MSRARSSVTALVMLAVAAVGPSTARAQPTSPDESEGWAASDVSIPVYGNYCGPGYPSNGGQSRPAIDAVDRVCKAHDACYEAHGMHDCGCDRALIAKMVVAAVAPGVSARGRVVALAAIEAFRQSPCGCRKKFCHNWLKCNWHGCRVVKQCHGVTLPGHGGLGPC